MSCKRRYVEKKTDKSSGNVIEVIRSVLKFFFFTKRFLHTPKAQNRLQRTKINNAYKKHLRGKKLLIHLFAFCAFA